MTKGRLTNDIRDNAGESGGLPKQDALVNQRDESLGALEEVIVGQGSCQKCSR